MILSMNYEEMQALNAGVRAVLGGPARAVSEVVPSAERATVEALPAFDGDLSVATLSDVIQLEEGVEALAEALRAAMDRQIVATHPAEETAVASYFDYAHVVAFLGKIQEMRTEMEALIEVVTGNEPGDRATRSFVFPD